MTKPFTITLERGGSLTCVVAEWGDGTQDFFGNLDSCRFRYPSLLPQDVHQVDNIKNFECNHTYVNRGNYKVRVLEFVCQYCSRVVTHKIRVRANAESEYANYTLVD